MASPVDGARHIVAPAPAGRALRLQKWDDIYIVYQPSSTETHVFNETTALIIGCLEHGPRPIQRVKSWTEAALGVDQGELGADTFAFALARLEELGLVEYVDDVSAAR